VKDPLAPKLVGTIATAGEPEGYAVDTAYAADSGGGEHRLWPAIVELDARIAALCGVRECG